METLSRIEPTLPLSIIIPIWNVSMPGSPGTECYDLLQLTKDCVQTIREGTTTPFELIIVDNASEATTKVWLAKLKQEMGDQLTVITNATNLGVAKGWNQGLRASKGRYIAIVNNDTLISKGWDEVLLPNFEKHKDKKLAIVSPAEVVGYDWKWPDIEKTDPPRIVVSRSNMFKDWKIYWPNLCRVYHSSYQGKTTWDWGFHGSWFVTDRAMWEDVGLMDENFVGGFYEDHDITWRMRDKGWRFLIDHSALYYHYTEQSMNIQQRSGCIERNRSYLKKKWGERTF